MSNLKKAFNEAFKNISVSEQVLPLDDLLRLYAHYKQATIGDNSPVFVTEADTRDAFKFNAWVQLKGMTEEKAMKEYISLVNKILN